MGPRQDRCACGLLQAGTQKADNELGWGDGINPAAVSQRRLSEGLCPRGRGLGIRHERGNDPLGLVDDLAHGFQQFLAGVGLLNQPQPVTAQKFLVHRIRIWFSKLSRDALKGASFTSPAQLRTAIDHYIEAHNATAKPIRWTKTVVKPSAPKRSYAELKT